MKLSLFLLSNLFTFGKGTEWLNYSFCLFPFPCRAALCLFPKVKRDLRSSQPAKKKQGKENEKVCVQVEGKPPKFQSSLILLHLVWESCTSKKGRKRRRIKAQL